MKINTKSLHAALSSLRSIIGSRQTLPILSCVKLECQFNKLTISASNIDCWKSVIIDCDGSLSAMCVNLNHFIAVLGDSEFTQMESTKSNLEVRYGSSVCKLGIIDPDTFPKSHEQDSMIKSGLSCRDVAEGLDAVSWAAHHDQTRINLCAVHIYSTDKEFTCEAADGMNGAFFDRALICPAMNLMIPPAFSGELSSALMQDSAEFSSSDSAVMVRHGAGLLWFTQVNAKYPDYTVRHNYKVRKLGELNTKQLLAVANQCSSLSDPNLSPYLKMTFSKSGIRIQFSGVSGSSVDRTLEGEFGDCVFNSNANSLVNCLKGINSESCVVSCDDNAEFITFLSFAIGDVKILTMAIRPK